MRMVRRLLPALGVLALLPKTGLAQSGRFFQDAWFWGAKAGNMTYWTKDDGVPHQAVQIGGEWLITRSRGALYVSLDQVLFNSVFYDGHTSTAIEDPLNGGFRQVNFGDMRRLSFAALAFPKSIGPFRPYGGAGFSLNFFNSAEPQGSYTTAQQAADIAATVDDHKTRASPIFMAGVQMQLMRLSVFGQAVYMPAQNRFLLNGNETYFLEAGVRYNVGSSIDGANR
jgi:hypothetical protein